MTADLANELYDVPVAHAGATEDWRENFVAVQTRDDEVCTEYRFQGALGFGGKFWRNPSPFSQGWYVNAYPEHETRPHVRAVIDVTNAALAVIEARFNGAF